MSTSNLEGILAESAGGIYGHDIDRNEPNQHWDYLDEAGNTDRMDNEVFENREEEVRCRFFIPL